jgi:hypothetical protein
MRFMKVLREIIVAPIVEESVREVQSERHSAPATASSDGYGQVRFFALVQ